MSSVDDEDMPLDEQIYHLRVGGLSILEIASRLKISKVEAGHLFQRFITELGKSSNLDSRESQLQLEISRLDRLQDAYWQQATQEHDQMVMVGKGADAYPEMMRMPPDKDAAKVVLDVIKTRSELNGLKQLNPLDAQVVAQVLVVGNNTAAFIEALREGQKKPELTSGDPDNDIEGTVEAEMEAS